MLEGLICPVCENTIEEIDLRIPKVPQLLNVDLKDRKYLDFFGVLNGQWDSRKPRLL